MGRGDALVAFQATGGREPRSEDLGCIKVDRMLASSAGGMRPEG